MTDRDFQKKILEALANEGGCVVGVRQLRKEIKSSPSTLNKYLKKMTELKLIRITIENNKSKICVVDLDFEKEFKKNTRILEKLDTQLYSPDLDENEKLFLIGNYLKIAMHQYRNHDVSLLFAESIQIDSKRIRIIKESKDRIWNNMKGTLLRLEGNSRRRMLNSLFDVYEIPESLEEYRGKKYVPSKIEIKKQRELGEKRKQEKYEKYQKFCQICGRKNPPSYSEGAKHGQKHGDFWSAAIKHGGLCCQYCGKKLPLDRVKARKHQETHRI